MTHNLTRATQCTTSSHPRTLILFALQVWFGWMQSMLLCSAHLQQRATECKEVRKIYRVSVVGARQNHRQCQGDGCSIMVIATALVAGATEMRLSQCL